MRDFSLNHRLEFLKMRLAANVPATATTTATSTLFLDVLEYSSAFGGVQDHCAFERATPPGCNNLVEVKKAVRVSKKARLAKRKREELDTKEAMFNVYRDVIPSENVKICKPVMALLESVRRLLHEEPVFEGNESLMTIAALCDFTLE